MLVALSTAAEMNDNELVMELELCDRSQMRNGEREDCAVCTVIDVAIPNDGIFHAWESAATVHM